MKTSLEDISSVKKKLLIEIEAKEVDKKLNAAYRDLGKRAKISGFRPGKVPKKILERRFGDDVADLAGTISYEIYCRIGTNPVKRFLSESSQS